jgi:hypothetical protein
MKRHLLLVVLVMVLVLGLSWGVCAANPNQYDIATDISSGYASGDLWIGTLDAWEANSGAVQDTDTFFSNGEAIDGDDIIITNGVCGIVLAVGTRNPWGYPAGSVLDAGTVEYTSGALTTATGNRDMTWSIEPLVNGWDSWAPDNCGEVSFSLVNYDFDAKAEDAGGLMAVKVFRIYDIGGVTFDVTTYYGIEAGMSYAYMFNEFENTTGSDVSVSNRFSVTNKGDDGGAMFAYGQATGSYAMSGGVEYFCGLYYPGDLYKKTGGSVGYKELRTDGDYTSGQTKLIDNYIVMSDTADFFALNALEYEMEGITDFTTVSGTTVANGTVIVKKGNDIIGWYNADAEGDFSFQVPQNDENTYTMYLEANGYADGESVTITNTGETFAAGDLAAGAAKAEMTLTVADQDDNPIFAKIEVFESADGVDYVRAYPTVRFNGDSIYYTEADESGSSTGVIDFEVEEGYYKVVVYGEGYWFYSEPVAITGNTEDGTSLDQAIDMVYSAPEGWLCGDTHHHGNKNDAFSSPEDVIKSLAASGLDVGFMTDHDFTTNNEEMYSLSADYGLTGFIPSEEISCSWAHFNVLPTTPDGYDHFLDVDQNNNVMDQFAQLPVFVDQTHQTGAAITANHPWYSYGLFYAASVDAIPGGYTDDYDNIEINASCADGENVDVLISTTDLWTSYQDGTALYQDVNGDDVVTEKAHYLVGGSDTHDVRYPGFSNINDYTNTRGEETIEEVTDDDWYASGKIRTYAYVGTDVTENMGEGYITENGLAFSEAVVEGHSYISYGPILDMDKIPGETYAVDKYSTFDVNVTVQDLYGDCQFYVLTKNGTTDIDYLSISQSNNMGDYLTYDAAATDASDYTYDEATGTYEYHISAPVAEEDTWVALLVMDGFGNYAMTNPWWVDACNFKDVPDYTWYKEVLVQAEQLDVVNGYTDGTFRPQNQVTRAEFSQMLYALLSQQYDLDVTNTDVSFSDVKSGSWYYDAVTYLAQRGFINGYGDGTFLPDSYIKRAEISQILYNICSGNFEEFLNGYRQAYFADVIQGKWYYEAIMTLADAGWLNGYPAPQVTTTKSDEYLDVYFLPETTATRAESLQFLRMFLESHD